MSFIAVVVVVCIIGTVGAHEADIDINRIILLPKENPRHKSSPKTFQTRRSILDIDRYQKKYDYDFSGRRVTEQHAPMQFLYNAPTAASTKAPLKLHQPREDPRLFYQSNVYLQEVDRKSLSPEITSTYLGRGVVRSSDRNYGVRKPVRIRTRKTNGIPNEISCIKCPRDRTLIAKVGVDRVVLQPPRLQTCSSKKAPRSVHFIEKYGPKFGSLIEKGSHIIIGHILHRNRILKTCKMQIHVLTQFCQVPKYLSAHCDGDQNRTCTFTCRDSASQPRGTKKLTCGDNLKWNGQFPSCNVPSWCAPPFSPINGRISCKGATISNGQNLKEGSICRLRCDRGWHRSSHSMTKCYRGRWTHELSCQSRKRKR